MQPLSPLKRRLYLYGLAVLFVLLLPLVIFYADGYRYRAGFGFVKTGGIFISVPYSDADVVLNGEIIGRSSFLERTFYIGNLTPGTYTVLVEREGAIPWIRALFVEPQLVTDAQVLFVPLHPVAIKLSTSSGVGTTTKSITVSDLAAIQAAFAIPTSTTTPGLSGETLAVEGGDILYRISEASVLPPSNFCIQPSRCMYQIPIERGIETAFEAQFFRGGIAYATKEGGVYFAEADIRPSPGAVQLYPVGGAEFRIVADSIVIKDGNSFYEIAGI